MKYDCIAFGSAILDVFNTSAELKINQDKQSPTGKSFSLPAGAKLKVNQLEIHSGGGGTNVAVGLSRLGVKSAVCARLGWDMAGKLIRQELKQEKVTDQLLVQFESDKTDWSTILIDEKGNSTILVWRGETKLEPSLLNASQLNSFWFYLASLEGNLDLVEFLLNLADQNHVRVVWNPGKREIEQKEQLLKLAAKVDTLIVNEEELLRLTKLSLPFNQAFDQLKRLLPKINLVVTRGSQGVRAKTAAGQDFNLTGLTVTQKDQTGAGDGFASGLTAGLIKQKNFDQALKIGLVNGAAVVTKIGAKPGLIYQRELDYWLSRLN